MTETWRAVLGWEGLYEVSDQGQVRSLDRVVVQRANGGKMMERFSPGRIMSAGLDNKGYRRTAFCRDGELYPQAVHALVLEAFVGPRPEGWVGDHINGVRHDNRVENLRWVSYRDNARNRWQPRGENPHVGVDYRAARNEWRARATDAQGRRIELGAFSTAEEAAAVYRQFRQGNP